jgi:hypothetical protein
MARWLLLLLTTTMLLAFRPPAPAAACPPLCPGPVVGCAPLYPPLCPPPPLCLACPVPAPVPVVCPPCPLYASPTAAPPSATPAPCPQPPPPAPVTPAPQPEPMTAPLSLKPTGRITEARFFDSYPVAARPGEHPDAARCSVSFWNLTDRQLTVRVAGRSHTVPAHQRLLLELERRFDWQVERYPPQTEEVKAAHAGAAIIIRR